MKAGIGKVLSDQGLFKPEMRENPYPVYKALRESDPVHWEESLQAWVLTRYEDVALALNDARFSSSRVAHGRSRFPDPKWDPLFRALSLKMSELDEPDHKRQRSLVHDAFMRTSVQQWEPRIRERVNSLLDTASNKPEFDFITEFSVPLPLLVIQELIGFPEEDRQQVKAWCDAYAVVALNYFAGISDEEMQRGMEATAEFREYIRRLADQDRTSSQQDLLSALVQASYEGSKLTLDELLANCLLLISAGNETTTCLLGNGLAALLHAPEQLALLRAEPERIPHAIEELLRFDSPVQFLGRILLEDVTLQEKTMRRGDLVLTVMAAANRDPERFERPDELDITRPNIPHLSFGHGPHFCAGAQLARLEAQIAFSTLLARFPTLALDDVSSLIHRENFNIRCFEKLSIRIG